MQLFSNIRLISKFGNKFSFLVLITLFVAIALSACGGGGGGDSGTTNSNNNNSNNNGDTTPTTNDWTQRLSGADMSIMAIVNTGTEYLAVGDPTGVSNNTLKSSDGASWNAYPVNTFGPLNLVDAVWTGSQYVGSTSGGFFYTSSDGVEWSLPTLPDPLNNVNSLAWSGSVIVAVGDSGSIYTSANGTDWTTRSSGVSVDLTKVEWLNNQFVVVGENGTILFSTDGISWNEESTSTTDYLIDVVWNGTLYVAASSLNYFTSTNGVTWSSAINTGGLVEDIAWSGTLGLFASVDTNGRITTSTDGSAWTERLSITEGASLRTVIWDGTQFIAGGDDGEIVTSTDGVDWVTQSSSMDLQNIIWNGSQFYAVGGFGKVVTSSDGITWSYHRTGDDGDYMYDIADSGSRLVAAGQTYYMSTAADLSWSVHDWTGATSVDNGVIWDGSQFISVGDSGGMRVSSDGLGYTYIYSTTTGTTNYLTDLVYTGSIYVVTGYAGTIITSPDLSAWSTASIGTTENLHAVAWSGSVFVAVGSNGTILTSPDGTNWTARTSGTSSSIYEVVWAEDEFVAVGASSTILTSPDGITWTESTTPEYYSTLKGVAYSGDRLVVVGLGGRIISYEK